MLEYFTWEIGSVQTRRYVTVPGRFRGYTPYEKADKAFAQSLYSNDPFSQK